MNDIVYFILSAFAVLVTLTVHEYCHGYAAYRLGDNTARNLGRLTLNPIKHIDPFGAICMLFFRFGWAKPVPINPRNFKNPRRDFAITALAGPLSNLIMSIISAIIYLTCIALFKNTSFENNFTFSLVSNFISFFYIFHIVNLGICIFNMIPVPPLDGSRILNVILPPRIYFGIMKYERNIYLVLVGWLLLGDIVASALLSVPIIASSPILSFVANIFSLSDLISGAIGKLSELIFKLLQLIPFFRF